MWAWSTSDCAKEVPQAPGKFAVGAFWALGGLPRHSKGLPVPKRCVLSIVANLKFFTSFEFPMSMVHWDRALGEPDAIPYLIIAHLYATMFSLGG